MWEHTMYWELIQNWPKTKFDLGNSSSYQFEIVRVKCIISLILQPDQESENPDIEYI